MVETGKRIAPYVFISPFLILFAVFGIFPILYSITISFFKWTLAGPQDFRGIQNYISLLTTDPFFIGSLKTTFILLVFGSLLQHVFAIPLAIVLNDQKVKGRGFFKVMYFLPYITSTVVIALVFNQLYEQNYGWFNFVIENWLGMEGVKWVQNPGAIKASIAIMVNWRFIGWNTIIYLAGLQSIDKVLYEAAEIDGASVWQQETLITLPVVWGIIVTAMTLAMAYGLRHFEATFLMTGGGPGHSTSTLALMMYDKIGARKLGQASTIGTILVIVGFIVIVTLNQTLGRKSLTGEDQ